MNFRLAIYNVSPMPKPTIPLTHARKTAFNGKLFKMPNLPIANKHMIKIMLVHERRTMFAETGLVFCNADLYSTADTVQLIAAPKAASSPIIVSHSSLGNRERILL